MNRFNLIPKLAGITFNLSVAAFIAKTILLLPGSFLQIAAAQSERPSGVSEIDTMFVAPPTGERETDRASIQTAFDSVKPGGTILFSPGTYLLGAGARLTVPDVTVLGHPEGTVLRGCEPEAFAVDMSQVGSVVFGCTGFYIQAERQTIQGLTFEYIWHAIVVGPYPTTEEEASTFWSSDERPAIYQVGGQSIEKNTFRSVANGLRMLGTGNEMSVVRDNDFIDVFHAIGIYGAPLHFLENRITVEDPESVPYTRHPGSTIIVSPVHTNCTGHIVAGNRVEGYPDPIYLLTYSGQTCRGVEIRDNTILAARVKIPDSGGYYKPTENDSTMIGAPITIMNRMEPMPGMPESDTEGVLEDILVQGNQIIGAEGVGILVQNASHNRIAGNTISGIQRRTPFSGIIWDEFEQQWEAANGSGIWLSPGSDGNEIISNTFEGFASSAVFVEGDSNRVEVLKADDAVHDLGYGNNVSTKNDHVEPLYESKFVEAGGIRLQFMDFDGSGLPVIFLQDYHDYFSIEEEEPQHSAWLSRFADEYRVLAPVRRGWGESDDTGYGYDVATQSEDLLGLMDALGIQRGVLVGRIPSNQDMTWIAEHHPERVAGLIYIGNPRVFTFLNDPDAIAFNENYHRGVCDADVEEAEKWEKRTGARQAWRPHFFTDPEARIDIPTLRFYNPIWEGRSLSLRRLEPESIKQLALSDHCGDEQAQRYFSVLAEDEKRLENLRQIFRETDPSRKLNETMERTFGSNMKTVVEEELMGLDEIYNFHFPHMRSFLKEIEQLESENE